MAASILTCLSMPTISEGTSEAIASVQLAAMREMIDGMLKLVNTNTETIERLTECVEVIAGSRPMTQPTWLLLLQCPKCKAVIRFDSVAPSWHESEEMEERLEAAHKFVNEHAGEQFPNLIIGNDEKAVERAKLLRPFEDILLLDYGSYGISVVGTKEVDVRAIWCACCGAEVFVRNRVDPLKTKEEM